MKFNLKCFPRSRRGRRPAPCTGTAASCLEITLKPGDCNDRGYSKSRFQIYNKSSRTIWALLKVPNFAMDGNFVVGNLPNEKHQIKQILPGTAVPLDCEEVGPLPGNAEIYRWRRRSYSIEQACYEDQDRDCRFFPEVPASPVPCETTFALDLWSDTSSRALAKELAALVALAENHVNGGGNARSVPFENIAPTLVAAFGLQRGAIFLEGSTLSNHGETGFIDIEVDRGGELFTLWLKLQPELIGEVVPAPGGTHLVFDEASSTPPSLILGRCDMFSDPVSCEPGIIERPVERIELERGVIRIIAHDHCVEIPLG